MLNETYDWGVDWSSRGEQKLKHKWMNIFVTNLLEIDVNWNASNGQRLDIYQFRENIIIYVFEFLLPH